MLKLDRIIDISPENGILLHDHQEHRLRKWMQTWNTHAKFDHKTTRTEQIIPMLELAQSLNMLGTAKTVLSDKTSLNSEEADRLSMKLRRRPEYDVFRSYEISYILQNLSSITKALVQAQIIDISPEGRISPKTGLSILAKKRCGELVETFYQAAKNTHKESKKIQEKSTERLSLNWNLSPIEIDKKIYEIIFGITPFRMSHQQIIKTIQDKSPETLKQAYQTLEAHLQNPQKPKDPYQRTNL